MKRIAQNILYANATRANGMHPTHSDLSCSTEGESYAVFSAEDKGFVIISKNEMTEPVIGYSYSADSKSQMPEALKFYLDYFDRASSEQQTAMLSAYTRSVNAIDPFITTKWGQDAPYNALTPEISDKHTPTGCVATAMSQIINYCQYPTSVDFMGSYSVGDNSNAVSYEPIKSTYTFPYKDEFDLQNLTADDEEVAVLVRDCGYAVEMNYNTGGSSAYTLNCAKAFINKFNYPSNAIKYYRKQFYSDADWQNIVLGELEKKCPVYLGGNDKSGSNGHAFFACGNDMDGKVYINWGWDGYFNGYYSLGLLNPSTSDFSYNTEAILGFRPQALETDVDALIFCAPDTPYSFEFGQTPGSSSYNLKAVITNGVFNFGIKDQVVNFVLAGDNKNTGETEIIATFLSSAKVAPLSGYSSMDKPIRKVPAAGEYRAYLAVCDASGKVPGAPVPVRGDGGPIYYDLVIDANGMTFSSTPSYLPTAITEVFMDETSHKFSDRTFNIYGQQVDSNYEGIIIKNGKKILNKTN